MAFHPEVERFLAQGRELGEMIRKVQASAFDDLRVRRAAPEEADVMPEVDGHGALKSLFFGEGICQRYTPTQVEDLFMSAMQECYAVLGDRRREAAQAAVPDFDLDKGFG
jgi:hypothetical protein